MRKDYVFSQSDSIDFELNDCGTDEFNLRFDGMLNFLFANVEIYSDSDRTISLSSSSWEYYTEDEYYTNLEAETGGSGYSIYSQIKIIDATYQTGTLYCTCDNFGSYASGNAQGSDYQEITADTTYTVEPNIREAVLVIPSSVTTQLTITLEQVTHPCGDAGRLNRVKVIDESSYDSGHNVTDSTTPYLVKLQTASFAFDSSSDLKWVSAGWESLWLDTSYSTYTVSFATMLRTPVLGQRFKGYVLAGGSNYSWVGDYLSETLTNGCSYAASSFLAIKGTGLTSEFIVTDTSHDLKSVDVWHNGE